MGRTSELPPLGEGAGYLSSDPHPPSIEGPFLGVAVALSTCGPRMSWRSLLLGGERQDAHLRLPPPRPLSEHLLWTRLLLRAFPELSHLIPFSMDIAVLFLQMRELRHGESHTQGLWES